MLPDIDGYEICFAIRKESQVPIVILSAKDDEVDKVVGFRMGVDDYVTKPFSSTELALRVKAILKRSRNSVTGTPNHNRVVAGDLVIDMQKREVTVGNRQVNLTTKEFDLLWFLANHPNQVFTRKSCLQRYGKITMPAILELSMSCLQAADKIESNPAHPQYIHTVWGVGYKFVSAETH